jgi:sugar lactone lactonase YvrE/enterochelin esterase-like enzyme
MKLPLARASLLAVATLAAAPVRATDDYTLGPDSFPKEGVPKGAIVKGVFQSHLYPGTTRDYWVYVPAQYKADVPACLMVFQDGQTYVKLDGPWRVPVVFDNLIHRKEMPVTIGLFISPGVVPAPGPDAQPRVNRSFEYDETTDLYARFLLEEMLPEVGKAYNFSKEPGCRAIAGHSSGGIAAFAVAWHRPDAFRRVFTTVGTYVGLRGGEAFPTLVRKTEPKPLRVFLQDGSNDLNGYGGSWWFANQAMLSALEFSGYEVNHAFGDGGHTPKHGGSILPEVLRWLWKGFPAPIKVGVESKQPVVTVVSPDEGWQLLGEGYQFTEGPATSGKGEVFFTDVKANRIHKIGLDGKPSVFVENSGGANGLMFGPDGRLYAAQSGRKRVVAYDAGGKEAVIADGIDANDLAVSQKRFVWVTEPSAKRLWVITPKGDKRVVDTGITFPNGLVLTPDQAFLYVADTRGRYVYSFQVLADGGLANKQPYCYLHVPDDKTDSGADGLAMDVTGRLYVTTHLGVQFCDQAGRVNGIIPKPQSKWLSNVEFGGAGMDELFVTSADRVYRRKTKTKGVLSWQAPIKPPTPRL